MEENQKPNSHSHLRGQDTPVSWSDLPLDLLNSIFERLSFANFHRAKAVYSSWHASSRQCVPKKHNHWLILFPEEKENDKNNYSCTLFNPEEPHDKLHKTQDLGLEFAKSFCKATYGSWLLMRYLLRSLYIVNLFTHKRINLPPVESQVVSDCLDVAYKESKIYFLSVSGCFLIFDLSGETPQQVFKCGVIAERLRLGLIVPTKLVVTVTGEVFKVEKWSRCRSETWSFRVSKVCSPGFLMKHQLVTSLGDESMLLDQGITVLANDGFIRDCIYLSANRNNTSSIFLFKLKTKKTEPLHNFDCCVAQFSRARWFLPSFADP